MRFQTILVASLSLLAATSTGAPLNGMEALTQSPSPRSIAGVELTGVSPPASGSTLSTGASLTKTHPTLLSRLSTLLARTVDILHSTDFMCLTTDCQAAHAKQACIIAEADGRVCVPDVKTTEGKGDALVFGAGTHTEVLPPTVKRARRRFAKRFSAHP